MGYRYCFFKLHCKWLTRNYNDDDDDIGLIMTKHTCVKAYTIRLIHIWFCHVNGTVKWNAD